MKNERGVAFTVALLLLLVLTLIGISAINSTVFETRIAGNQRAGNSAFYAADGGVNVGVSRVPNVASYSGDVNSEARYRSGHLTSSGPQPQKKLGVISRPGFEATWEFRRFQVNATGDSSGAKKEIEIQLSMGPYNAGTQYNN